MKKNYILPSMEIKEFFMESVLTTSTGTTNSDEVREYLKNEGNLTSGITIAELFLD